MHSFGRLIVLMGVLVRTEQIPLSAAASITTMDNCVCLSRQNQITYLKIVSTTPVGMYLITAFVIQTALRKRAVYTMDSTA